MRGKRYAVIGDIHFNSTEFSDYILESFFDIVNSIKEDGEVSYAVILGDIFDKPILTPDLAFNISKYLNALVDATLDKKVIIVCGNHDYSPRYNVSAIKYLESNTIQIIDEITVIDNFCYVPHSYKTQTIIDKYKVVFSHTGIANLQISTTYSYTSQDIISFNTNPDLLFLGHIHTPFDGVVDNVPTIIPGSICPVNWSDSSDQRYFYIYKGTNREKVIKIKHPYTLTVHEGEEMPTDQNILIRMVLSDPKNIEKYDKSLIKSVAVEKIRKTNHRGLEMVDLIKSLCAQYGASYLPVKEILEGVGLIVG